MNYIKPFWKCIFILKNYFHLHLYIFWKKIHDLVIFWKKKGEFFFLTISYNYMYIMKDFFYILKTRKLTIALIESSSTQSIISIPTKKMILLNWSKISSIYNVDQLEKCYRTIAGAESKTIIDKMHCQNQYFPTEYLQFVTEFIDSSIRCIWFKFFVAFIKYRKSYNLRHIRVLVFVGKFMSEILLWYAFTYHS